jgi:hypothetical protein
VNKKSHLFLAEKQRLQHNVEANKQLCIVHRKEPPPMSIEQRDRSMQVNWIAIFSYTASAGLSVAIWAGIFRLVSHLVR